MPTTTTFDHLGGVGVNGRWRVYRDGRSVAIIRSSGRRGWVVETYYSRIITRAGSSAAAKVWCTERETFASRQEIYDVICVETEARRREHLESVAAQKLAALGRALVAGSNSAHDEFATLFAEIDALARDRDKSTKPPTLPFPSGIYGPEMIAAQEAYRDSLQEWFQGEPMYWPASGHVYPDPPEDNTRKESPHDEDDERPVVDAHCA